MLRKSITVLVALILVSTFAGPLDSASARKSKPDCPPFDPAFLRGKEYLQSLPPECAKAYKKTARQNLHEMGGYDVTIDGGPDEFGYTYDDTVGYGWISASTDSGLTGDDDVIGPIDLGFNFPFYGFTQTQFYVSTNGLITFGSADYGYGGGSIPDPSTPNNFIAPFWEDLLVGSPDNDGGIYFSQGGSAPNRYFVVEWRDVTTYNGSSPFSFEAILYENGDVVVQHQSLPEDYYSTVGIEDSFGIDGLQYQRGNSGLSTPRTIRFYYPTTPTVRVLVSPFDAGLFAGVTKPADFLVTVSNTGSYGADIFDLTASSAWTVQFFTEAGALLPDTDGDLIPDTGMIPMGTSTNVIARVIPPVGAKAGDHADTTVTAASSLNPAITGSTSLFTSVPANFVQVFSDGANDAMSFMSNTASGSSASKVTLDNRDGFNMAVTALNNGTYLYTWVVANNRAALPNTEHIWPGGAEFSDLEYAIVRADGTVIRPVTKLVDNSDGILRKTVWNSATAVTPNGVVGVLWNENTEDTSIDMDNSNIFFATLDVNGNLLSGPTNITNNAIWGSYDDLNRLWFTSPTIAATDDNRFVLGWEKQFLVDVDNWDAEYWYSTRASNGAGVFAPAELPTYEINPDSDYLSVNTLNGGKAIFTWQDWNEYIYYTVVDSNGYSIKAPTILPGEGFSWYWDLYHPDAVQLPNGKVAIAYSDNGHISYVILNSDYEVETLTRSSSDGHYAISVTTDIDSHVIVTASGSKNLYYVLGDSEGNIITPSMIFKTSESNITISGNGQGNAPLPTFGDVPPNNWAAPWIERLYAAGVTGGCGTGMYCPNSDITRAQMAVFLLVAKHGTGYTPPAATGLFNDVPADNGFAKWIEQMAAEGITGGCGGGNFCPNAPVTREQMAVFLLVARHGTGYTPPTASGIFTDVPVGDPFAPWIEQLAAEGITGGCGGGNFCPSKPVTRAQMAIFLVAAFNLP